MNYQKLIIRVDASSQIGLGHLIRCFSISSKLLKNSITPIIVTKNHEQNVIDQIKSLGLTCETLDPNLSLSEDAKIVSSLALKYNTDTIITDLSSVENISNKSEYLTFFKILKENELKIIAIDDFEKVDFPIDVHIIPYSGAERIEYKKFKESTYLLGPSYYVANENLVELSKKDRVINKSVKKILVTIGGTDNDQLTIDSILALNCYENLQITVAIGSCFNKELIKKIEQLVETSNNNYQLKFDADIPELLYKNDLAITGVGITRYESAMVGTPSICLTRTDLLVFNTDTFVNSKAFIHLTLKNNEIDKLKKSIDLLINDYEKRIDMSKLCKKSVDGMGIDRIMHCLKEHKYIKL